jgi:uncharacterized protein
MSKRKPQEPIRPFPYCEQKVSFRNPVDQMLLHGTLTLPDTTNRHPAMVLVSGSGAQNRDEEILGHKPFFVIADALTRAGIAVLRYDDRHYKMSVKKGWRYTTLDLAGDVKAALDFLAHHANIDASFLGVAGHSEGGTIAPIVASSDSRVAFLISLAGTAVSGKIIAVHQENDLASDDKDREFTHRVNAMTISEPDYRKRKSQFWKIFNSVYGRFHWVKKFFISFSLEMAISEWNRFFHLLDPMEYWRNVTCPVLALNGEYDIQVLPEENLRAMEEALISAGNSEISFHVISKANHLFQTVDSGGPKSYTNLINEYRQSEQTISPEVLSLMKDWILSQYAKQPK